MGTMVAGAPLLGLGPPGWAAYAALGVATVVGGVLIYERSRDRAPAVPTTRTDTARQRCNRPWSVRVQAQGDVIGGRGGATLGAPPIVKAAAPVTVAEGLGLSAATFAMLSRGQARVLARAKAQADAWIANRPPHGALGQKTFRVPDTSNRFDVDSYGCSPNFIA